MRTLRLWLWWFNCRGKKNCPKAVRNIEQFKKSVFCLWSILSDTSINHLDRFRASPVNDIFCQSLPGSPLKPHNLEQLEKQQEMMKMPFRRAKEVGGFFLVFCFFFFLSLKVFTIHVIIHIMWSSVEQVVLTYVRRLHQTLEQSLSLLLIYVAYLIGRKTYQLSLGNWLKTSVAFLACSLQSC